jgi:hypothetical protein
VPPGHTDRVENVLYLRLQRCLHGVAAGLAQDLHSDSMDRQARPEQQHLASLTPEQNQKAELFPTWEA